MIDGRPFARPEKSSGRFGGQGTAMRFWRDKAGTATLIAAFGMVAIMGMLALAIDVGQLRYQQRNLQRAADAAALASVLELSFCSGSTTCSNMQNAAWSALSENGLTPTAMAVNCGSAPSTGLALIVNNPPCSQGSQDPKYMKGGTVEVVLTQAQATTFARTFGFNTVPVSVRAEATSTGGPYCIYALDPTGGGALTVQAGASVISPCGIMVESSSNTALSCSALGLIGVTQIEVVGGVQNFLCAIAPTPLSNVNVPNPADPLSALPAPTAPACGTTTTSPFHGAPANVNITGTALLYSDAAYCGGITIKSGATVTFAPGTYVLTSTNGGANRGPGGLAVDLGTNVTGTGVTFYNYGPSGGITFTAPSLSLAGVRFTAPTMGIYSGILFFQPANNTSPATLVGSAAYNTVLEGSYYFPKATVSFAFDGPVNYNILVAYRIVFQSLSFGFTAVTSLFSNNYTSLANGSPLAGVGAVLTQ